MPSKRRKKVFEGKSILEWTPDPLLGKLNLQPVAKLYFADPVVDAFLRSSIRVSRIRVPQSWVQSHGRTGEGVVDAPVGLREIEICFRGQIHLGFVSGTSNETHKHHHPSTQSIPSRRAIEFSPKDENHVLKRRS